MPVANGLLPRSVLAHDRYGEIDFGKSLALLRNHGKSTPVCVRRTGRSANRLHSLGIIK